MRLNIREKLLFKTNENKGLLHGLTVRPEDFFILARKIWYNVVIPV